MYMADLKPYTYMGKAISAMLCYPHNTTTGMLLVICLSRCVASCGLQRAATQDYNSMVSSCSMSVISACQRLMLMM